MYEVRFVITACIEYVLNPAYRRPPRRLSQLRLKLTSTGTKPWPQFKADLAPISGTTGGPPARRQSTPELEWGPSSGCER